MEMEFELHRCPLSYANALRRVIISEIPTMAIDFVEISQNTTPLSDEFITHRLGLIPLHSQLAGEFSYKSECQCLQADEVCSSCSVKFELSVSNESENPIDVCSNQLKLVQATTEKQKSVVPVRFKLNPESEEWRDILLMKLGRNQVLKLTCVAHKGKGQKHAKFSPVSVVSLKRKPLVSLNDSSGMGLTKHQ